MPSVAAFSSVFKVLKKRLVFARIFYQISSPRHSVRSAEGRSFPTG